MADPRMERLADVLVSYSVEVREGEVVLVQGSTLAAPLIVEICRRVLRAGGHPLTRIGLDGAQEALIARGTDAQLEWINPRWSEEIETINARVQILADANTRSLSGADPARQAQVSRARSGLLQRLMDRAATGELRSVITAHPTNAAAQEARMSLEQYTAFMYRAGLIDRDDPVAAWRELGARIGRIAERLAQAKELRVVGHDTDLSFSVEGRTWIPCDGRQNFPDGEVFTSPIAASVEGTIRFSYPAVFGGRAVEDVRLRFAGGEVVEASAARGQPFLEEMLGMDEGARRAGEFAFGLNDAVEVFTGEALFDEKIDGSVHLALGAAFPESGGDNTSALHWDMVCDLRRGGEVYADGELVYRDGRFLQS